MKTDMAERRTLSQRDGQVAQNLRSMSSTFLILIYFPENSSTFFSIHVQPLFTMLVLRAWRFSGELQLWKLTGPWNLDRSL
jgi:hypothetical protein